MKRTTHVLALLALAALAGAAAAGAAPVRQFLVHSAEGFGKGTLEGVRTDALGALELGAGLERVAALDAPYVLCAARVEGGWVVGTGNEGKVLRVADDGAVEVLFAASEPEVFAVAVAADGTVYAASSPNGKVYRFRKGAAEPWYEPGELYVWALAFDRTGALLVATGTRGRLFRVAPDGRGELLAELPDTHARALLPLADGRLLVGTAGRGLLVERGAKGELRTLLEPPQPEVAALAEGADGIYLAAVASEASWAEPGARAAAPAAAAPGATAASGEPQPVVTVTGEGETPGPSSTPAAAPRGPGKGPRSELWRVDRVGRRERLDELAGETVYGLLWHAGRLWVATGVEGRLYSLEGGRLQLERDLDERQLVGFAPGAPPALVATNGGALYRLSAEREAAGAYVSPALDAGAIARFGELRWRGSVPRGATLRWAVRSGAAAEPDETWSPWSEPEAGEVLGLATVPLARYLQFRAELAGAEGRSPRIVSVEISYRQENLRPRIERFEVLDPGQVLVPQGFNPAEQIFEPANPARGGVFTTLRRTDARPDGRLKQLWKIGFRTLRWKVEDPNGDPLRYDLDFRLGAGGEWMPMARDLEDDYYSFDAQALPDGLCWFRLRASDGRANPGEEALVAEQVSEPVTVDHSPPVLVRAERVPGGWLVEVADAASPLRAAEVSVDGGPWQPVAAADGLLDGRVERLRVAVPEGARLALLRVSDAAFNQVSFQLAEEAR
ncbi:MAG TPA: hypothetical protein VLA75_12305 [Thermoanaerobaculia bacterium]|nr:hypothetical protein [Thermoanaerobaculia bacterium]